MALFAFVLVAPVVYTLYLSLFRDRIIGGTTFVGLGNYIDAFHDPLFWGAALRILIFFLLQVPLTMLLGLLAALALDSGLLYWGPLYRISIFLPYAVPAVVATLMWGFMYGAKFGLVGNLNNLLGTDFHPLAGNTILGAIANIVLWEFVGYDMLIFYAALRAIPGELYEAAALDGAGTLRIAWNVKLPAIRPAIVVSGVFSIVGSFQLFNEPNLLKVLAPNVITTSYTPNIYAYNLAFSGQRLPYAATIAIVMGVLTAVIAYVVQRVGTRGDES